MIDCFTRIGKAYALPPSRVHPLLRRSRRLRRRWRAQQPRVGNQRASSIPRSFFTHDAPDGQSNLPSSAVPFGFIPLSHAPLYLAPL